jgi:hypothetical protein
MSPPELGAVPEPGEVAGTDELMVGGGTEVVAVADGAVTEFGAGSVDGVPLAFDRGSVRRIASICLTVSW